MKTCGLFLSQARQALLEPNLSTCAVCGVTYDQPVWEKTRRSKRNPWKRTLKELIPLLMPNRELEAYSNLSKIARQVFHTLFRVDATGRPLMWRLVDRRPESVEEAGFDPKATLQWLERSKRVRDLIATGHEFAILRTSLLNNNYVNLNRLTFTILGLKKHQKN